MNNKSKTIVTVMALAAITLSIGLIPIVSAEWLPTTAYAAIDVTTPSCGTAVNIQNDIVCNVSTGITSTVSSSNANKVEWDAPRTCNGKDFDDVTILLHKNGNIINFYSSHESVGSFSFGSATTGDMIMATVEYNYIEPTSFDDPQNSS